MHRALGIVEIVELICQNARGGSLASLAATCPAFREPSLDGLWGHQDTLLNLLKCMPDGLWDFDLDEEEGEVVSLLRSIVPADWERFLFYSPRVKSFSFDDLMGQQSYPPSLLATLRLSFPGPILFPNLQTLEWRSSPQKGTLHHIRLFLSPLLQDLSLSFLNSQSHMSLLPIIRQQCPLLRNVKIEADENLDGLYRSFSSLTVSLPQLRSLHVPCVDHRALEYLARLPDLKSLTLGEITQLRTIPITQYDTFFPALETLDVFADDAEVVRVLQSLLEISPLREVRVRLPGSTFSKFCQEIGSRSGAHESLETLHLSARGIEENVGLRSADSQPYVLRNDDMLPLFVFTNLTEVVLNPPFGLDLDDAGIASIAPAWPQIHILSLGTHAPELTHPESRVTLASLLSFAQHCPHLSQLELPLNSAVAPKPQTHSTGAPRIQQTKLKWLGVHCCPVQNAMGMAVFLSSVFPGLRLIESPRCPLTDTPENPAATRQKMWRAVERWLPVLSKVRAEERDWALGVQE